MKFKSIIFTMIAAILASGAVFAEEKKDDGPGTLSGKIYLNYNIDLQNSDGSDKVHGFDLERIYFTYRKNISEKFSTRVTMDVYSADFKSYTFNDAVADGGNGDGVVDANEIEEQTSSRGLFFVKYAYLQYKDKLAGIKTKFQVGQIGNPIIGLTDKMSGMRWITKNQIDSANLNNSADLGAKVSLGFFGLATLTTAYLNGEGYKYIGGDENKGKSSDTVLSITPLGKKLLVNGYFKYAKDEDDVQDTQVGGGIAWVDSKYKAGVNFLYDTENKNSYLDSWVNVNFKGLVGAPVLLMGRFQMILPDTGDNTTTFMVGPGYKLHKMIQVAVIFDYSKTGDADADYNMSIQSEFKF